MALTVVSGRFLPDLEKSFLERHAALKTDPLKRVAVVAPSLRLMERLQLALAESGTPVINTHFHTFTSLAENVVASESPLEHPILSDPLFFDTLVKRIIKEDRPFEYLADLAVPEGFPATVRSTLRDLLDAGIDREKVEEAIGEEFVGKPVDLGTLRSLLQLHRIYLSRLDKLKVIPRAQLTARATELAPESAYLGSFEEILYYGFYDLTGLQYEFFKEVVNHHPSRLFFPYVHEHPAYVFAKRFRDTFLQPVMREEIRLESPSTLRISKSDVRLINVSGLRDEAWTIAGEVARLHQEQGIPYSQMAVIVRSKDRLRGNLPDALKDRAIPFRSSAKESLAGTPQAQMAFRFLEMAEGDPGPVLRRELEQFPEYIRLPDGETSMLADWPDTDSWTNHVLRTRQALDQHFAPRSNPSGKIWSLLKERLTSLSVFEAISTKVSRREFFETLQDGWSRVEMGDFEAGLDGVSLLYAEAARGLPYRVVFVAGVEEKVFPRIIREDPFLRDSDRMALNQVLGNKIGQKMTALEEERLLFELFVSAASEKLYLLYQRSDDDGAVVGASAFLRAFQSEQGFSEDDVESVPRSSLAKIREAQPLTLGVRDAVVGFLEADRADDAVRFAEAIGADSQTLARGLKLQSALQSFGNPGPYDGLVGPHKTANLFYQGQFSPTSLETYGVCPFKFFATKVLRLDAIEDVAIEERLAGDFKGKLIHTFLKNFYEQVTEGGKSVPDNFPESTFNSIFESVVNALPASKAQLHPVHWDVLKTELKESLRTFVEVDLNWLKTERLVPFLFEQDIVARLDAPIEGEWRGRIDRADKGRDVVRLVDYKTGKPLENTISSVILSGRRAQPPVYLLLAEKFLAARGESASDLVFSYLHPTQMDSEEALQEQNLYPEDWNQIKPDVLNVLSKQIELIHKGNFVIFPSAEVKEKYCDYCEIKRICRINHSLSAYRSKQGDGAIVRTLRSDKGGES